MTQYFQASSGAKLAYNLYHSPQASQQLLILVHGTCATRSSLFFPSFFSSPSLNILTFDLEGNGESEGEFKIGGFDREVQNIHEIVQFSQSSGFQVVALVGHSKGGNSILIYASIYNDVPLMIPIAARFNMTVLPKFLEPILPDVDEKGAAELWLKGKKFFIGKDGIDERRNLDMRLVIRGIRARVVVVYGTEDFVTPESDALAIVQELGDRCFKVVRVEGADHFFVGFGERLVQDVVQGVREFLDRERI